MHETPNHFVLVPLLLVLQYSSGENLYRLSAVLGSLGVLEGLVWFFVLFSFISYLLSVWEIPGTLLTNKIFR